MPTEQVVRDLSTHPPTDVLKQVICDLAPYLQELFNRSLVIGHFPRTRL